MIHTLTPSPAIDRLLVVPAFKQGEHIQVTRSAATPAGKGINVSRYLQAMETPSTAWALVGRREVSWYREVLTAAGITAGIFPIRGATRQNVTIAPVGGRETHLREPSPEVDPVEWAALAGTFASHLQSGDVAVIAGAVPRGITAAMLADVLIPAARRAAVIADINGPVAQAFFERAEGVWFKGNREEIAALIGRRFSADALVEAVKSRPDLPGLIATAAADEVLAVLRTSSGKAALFSARPPKVKHIESSVGAGDAFTAGLALEAARFGLAEKHIADALRRAAALGSASLASAAVGAVDRTLVDSLFNQVVVERF